MRERLIATTFIPRGELKVSSRIAMTRVAFLTSPPRHRVHVLPISVSLYYLFLFTMLDPRQVSLWTTIGVDLREATFLYVLVLSRSEFFDRARTPINPST